MPGVLKPIATFALLSVLVLAACGDDDDSESATSPTSTTGAAVTGACSPIEEVDVGPYKHVPDELTADDYDTNPPSGGDHNDAALTSGQFYEEGASLGEAVHLLEHGAVIGWTNGLSPDDRKAVQDAFNDAFVEGYYQLAVVENPDLEVPFALSAWGALQTCDEVDTSVIQPFIEEWYASPKSAESALACEGEARRLPPC